MKNLLLIGGPTAVGKTELATCLFKEINSTLISCDSMQIYKYMNIGTGKISPSLQKKFPHALIDIINPDEEFSVFDYKTLATKEINNSYKQNKLPIVVGGTGLYMKALLFPYSFNNSSKNCEIREHYRNLAKQNGNEFVYNILKEKDGTLAENLHPNDLKRVIRKLEILDNGKNETNNLTSEYNYTLIALNLDRQILYEKINSRVDEMFSLGLIDEVNNVVKNFNLTRNSQSMQAIGYKEFFDYFENKIDKNKLIELIKQHSRNYAKRQITWFKTMPNVMWFNISEKQKIIDFIKQKYDGWFENI